MKLAKLFIVFFIVLFINACKVVKTNTTVKQNNTIGVETKIKKETTTQLVKFFDAENARVLGESAKSILLYENFIKLYPSNATAHYNLAKLHFSKRDYVNAEKNAKIAFDLDDKNIFFQEFYSQLLVYNNNIKQALVQYDNLIKKTDNNSEYIYRKALLYLKSNDIDKAIASLNEYEKKRGPNEEIFVQKKNLYLKQKKYDLAIQEIEKAILLDPTNVDYPLTIAEIYDANNQKKEANETYEKIKENFSDNPTAVVAITQHYLQEKNDSMYFVYLQKIMQNNNMTTESKIALLLPIIKNNTTKDLSKIIQLNKDILKQDVNNKEANLLLAAIYQDNDLTTEAIAQYKKCLALDSSNTDVWTQLSSIYFTEKKYDSVIYVTTKSEPFYKSKTFPQFYKATALIEQKEYTKGISLLEKLSKTEKENQPLLIQIYSSLGDVYNTQQKYNLSDSAFSNALKINPNEATVLNNYAYYLSERNERLEDAEKMSKLSLDLQPNSKSFLDTYGWILYKQGKFIDAKVYIDKAIKSDKGNDATLYEHLGDVYNKLNDAKNALENWNKALQINENNLELLQKIKALNSNDK